MADMTLTDFLLARIAEDEAAAKAATQGSWTAVGTAYPDEGAPAEEMLTGYVDIFDEGGPTVVEQEIRGSDAYHIARHDPARVLAECEAKRRIMGLHQLAEQPTYRQTECCARCTAGGEYPADDDYTDEQNWPCPTLRALASFYADHPDYREEWKP